MPYARSLQAYTPPEFFREAPVEWTRRLREISPEMPNLDRLVFRWMEPTNPDGSDRGWQYNERGQWALYTAKPISMVDPERAEQFRLHWSELPTEQQPGREAMVSNYQHFMWHSQGLYVKPFLILQGEWGGTPAKYTEQETAFLEGSGCFSEPFPYGLFPACPFDERTVKQITLRDRLLTVSNSYGALEKLDTADAIRDAQDAATILKRQTAMDTWRQMIQPSVEFMKLKGSTKQVASELPPAPKGLADTVARWKDQWIQHGSFPSVGPAPQKRLQVAVL